MDGFDLIERNRRSGRRMNGIGRALAGRRRSGDVLEIGKSHTLFDKVDEIAVKDTLGGCQLGLGQTGIARRHHDQRFEVLLGARATSLVVPDGVIGTDRCRELVLELGAQRLRNRYRSRGLRRCP